MKYGLSNIEEVGQGENRDSGARRSARQRLSGLSIVLMVLLHGSFVFAEDQLFDLKEVADGVYIAIARPGDMIHCNAAVIILEDGVMVVDTHSTPSAARSLINQIKSLTDKPIRYVVNTHYHYDHFQGNPAYLEDCPGVELINYVNTYRGILKRGIPRVKANIAGLTQQIESLKRELDGAGEAGLQAELREEISKREGRVRDYRQIVKNTLPTMIFEKSLVLNRKDRRVEILFLGRGHTDGDTVVFLPEQKILVTGDLLHAWAPYMPDCYPYEWIRTLEAMEGLDFEKIISGHGDVLEGKGQVTLWKNYLTDLMEEVNELYGQGNSLEEIKEKADLSKYIPLLVEFGEYDINAHIEKAYNEVSWSP